MICIVISKVRVGVVVARWGREGRSRLLLSLGKGIIARVVLSSIAGLVGHEGGEGVECKGMSVLTAVGPASVRQRK
jgi:hypothetical protein